MGTGASDVVLVFGHVGQEREVAEGPHELYGLLAREGGEHVFEFVTRFFIAIAVVAYGRLTHAFDESKRRRAVANRDHFTEQTAKEPDILP